MREGNGDFWDGQGGLHQKPSRLNGEIKTDSHELFQSVCHQQIQQTVEG